MYFGSIEIKLVILIALFFYGKGAFTHDMLTGRTSISIECFLVQLVLTDFYS